jgi:uncharacterized membrane protein YdfJ with MMPL/SSD domain
LAIVFLVSTAVPSLEQVSTHVSVSLSPKDAPSVQAMERMGQKFKESDSDSFAMIVLESQQRLGDDAHRYYNSLIRQLKDDPTHVQHVQDFWGDPLRAPSVLKGTLLEDAKIYLAGTAATFKDWKDGSKYDLWIAGIGALCLIFIIMLIITEASSPPW